MNQKVKKEKRNEMYRQECRWWPEQEVEQERSRQ